MTWGTMLLVYSFTGRKREKDCRVHCFNGLVLVGIFRPPTSYLCRTSLYGTNSAPTGSIGWGLF